MDRVAYLIWYSAAIAVGVLELGIMLVIAGGAAVKRIKNKKGK